MPTIDVACSCGRVLKAPAKYAGKKGRCKGCGATIQIPDEPPPETFAVADPPSTDGWADLAPSSADDAALITAVSSIDTDDEEDDALPLSIRRAAGAPSSSKLPFIPPEPWYYGFLVIYARWAMGIGLVVCALICLSGFIIATLALSSGELAGIVYGLSVMALGAFGIIPVLLASAPILLAVDAARNLRAMRYAA